MKKKILFLTISSNKVGIGHYKRTSLLADNFGHLKFESLKIIISDNIKNYRNNKKEIFLNKDNYNYLNNSNIKNYINKVDIFICDSSNIKMVHYVLNFLKIIKIFLPSYSRKIIYPSSLFSDKLIDTNLNFFSTIIWPYYSPKINKKKIYRNINYLIGTKYFVFNKNLKIKKSNYSNQSLLVTCGGSDPKEYSLRLIKIIEEHKKILKINLVIAAQFSENLKLKILSEIKGSKHKYKLFFSPKNLDKIINQSGYAISTSGLTKYELFYSRTPSIIIPLSKSDAFLNKPFIKKTKFLEIDLKINKEELLKKISIIIYNNNYKMKFFNNSFDNINLKGFQNIKKNILKPNNG